MIGVGILGAGLIGHKRAQALDSNSKLIAVFDPAQDRAKSLADKFQAQACQSADEIFKNKDISVVIVSTTNNVMPELASDALLHDKDVLIEKPGGRTAHELEQLKVVMQKMGKTLRVGFNHRFHPAIQKVKKTMESDPVGPLMYIRARYGHGGRVGYDKEWRGIPEIGGGGELLDQGVHLIDLCRFFGGNFNLKFGHCDTFFWDMPVEDNGFMLLEHENSKAQAFLHASCTEWKNLFDFEVFTRMAKLQVWGLGRSYGVEEFRYYKMKPEMGPPETIIESFPGEDLSWNLEYQEFLREIKGEKTHIGTIDDAIQSVRIVQEVYRKSGFNF
jgi:predicted dehydrogenase